MLTKYQQQSLQQFVGKTVSITIGHQSIVKIIYQIRIIKYMIRIASATEIRRTGPFAIHDFLGIITLGIIRTRDDTCFSGWKCFFTLVTETCKYQVRISTNSTQDFYFIFARIFFHPFSKILIHMILLLIHRCNLNNSLNLLFGRILVL